MSNIPTESRIFTNRYIREARRLEELHADRLAPGATTWEEAIETLYQRMVQIGPVKGAKLVKQAAGYLHSVTSGERSHLVVTHHCASRNARLVLATFHPGPHPDQSVKEDGLSVVLHLLSCTRCVRSRAVGIPVAFFSKHAMSRLHQRGHNIGNTNATGIFSYTGLLGLLTRRLAHGDLSLLFSDTLLVGSQHRCPATDGRGRPNEDVFVDVRSILSVEEIGDSRWALLEQGRAAAAAVVAWFSNNDPQEELAARIPVLPRRADCYPVRTAAIATPEDPHE